jgi:hypothetical protein
MIRGRARGSGQGQARDIEIYGGEVMRAWIEEIDRLLRGDFTSPETLRTGRIPISAKTLVAASLALGAVYGFCMGFYRVAGGLESSGLQVVATILKVPLVFLLTLLVTFPSLYVFSALFNSCLGVGDTVRLLIAAIAVNMALLASFGPVTMFFTFCTDSYPFMKVLNVFFFTVSGLIGLGFLYKALTFVFERTPLPAPPASPPSPPPRAETEASVETDAPAERVQEVRRKEKLAQLERQALRMEVERNARVRRVFATWLVIYAVVGAQMGWILRPFIGAPELPFQIFRERQSNFFLDLLSTLAKLFS